MSGFSVFELLLISLTAALGIAVKPVVYPLVRIITGPLMVPTGVLAGGIYMMFLVLACGMTRKRLSGTLTATVQAFIVILTGIGSHGVMTFVTYILPGVAVDLAMLAFHWRRRNARPGMPACFFGGMAANVTGSLLVGVALFNIPAVPMLFALSVAALSGGLGGILAYFILKQIARLELLVNDGGDNGNNNGDNNDESDESGENNKNDYENKK